MLTLLVAIVGVRAFGLARPVLRYAERLLSHEQALGASPNAAPRCTPHSCRSSRAASTPVECHGPASR